MRAARGRKRREQVGGGLFFDVVKLCSVKIKKNCLFYVYALLLSRVERAS